MRDSQGSTRNLVAMLKGSSLPTARGENQRSANQAPLGLQYSTLRSIFDLLAQNSIMYPSAIDDFAQTFHAQIPRLIQLTFDHVQNRCRHYAAQAWPVL